MRNIIYYAVEPATLSWHGLILQLPQLVSRTYFFARENAFDFFWLSNNGVIFGCGVLT